MILGKDFFKILNLVVQIMRLFAGIFGDKDDKQAVEESKARTISASKDEAC